METSKNGVRFTFQSMKNYSIGNGVRKWGQVHFLSYELPDYCRTSVRNADTQTSNPRNIKPSSDIRTVGL